MIGSPTTQRIGTLLPFVAENFFPSFNFQIPASHSKIFTHQDFLLYGITVMVFATAKMIDLNEGYRNVLTIPNFEMD